MPLSYADMFYNCPFYLLLSSCFRNNMLYHIFKLKVKYAWGHSHILPDYPIFVSPVLILSSCEVNHRCSQEELDVSRVLQCIQVGWALISPCPVRHARTEAKRLASVIGKREPWKPEVWKSLISSARCTIKDQLVTQRGKSGAQTPRTVKREKKQKELGIYKD